MRSILRVHAMLPQVPADRDARDSQRVAHAVICLHQDAEDVRILGDQDASRRGADAAFELVADRAGAGADIPLCDRPTTSAIECGIHVLRPDVKPVDVIEVAVPGFSNDRSGPPVATGVGVPHPHSPCNHGVVHDADTVRVGEDHGPLEAASFFEPRGASHLAIAIQSEPGTEYRYIDAFLAPRQDRGNTGADFVFGIRRADQRCLTDRDSRDIGDRIERAGLTFERNAKIACARCGSRCRHGYGEQSCRPARQFHHNVHSGDDAHAQCRVRAILQARQDKQ